MFAVDLDSLVRKLNPPTDTGHLRRCFCEDGCLPAKRAVLIQALLIAIQTA